MILKRKTEKTSRSQKVSEIIRKAISEVLVRNEMPLDIPFKFPISVIKVEMNSDLKIAYVYVTTHEEIEHNEIRNIEVVQKICILLDEYKPMDNGSSYSNQITSNIYVRCIIFHIQQSLECFIPRHIN